jgi:hypothetical protein
MGGSSTLAYTADKAVASNLTAVEGWSTPPFAWHACMLAVFRARPPESKGDRM